MSLDVHAIDELNKKGVPLTNEKPKYNYIDNDDGNYGQCSYFLVAFFMHKTI